MSENRNKIIQINSGIVGSTGTIMLAIDEFARNNGFDSYVASVKNRSSKKEYKGNHIIIGTIIEKRIHRFLSINTGKEGMFSAFATYRLLKTIDSIHPRIIHLHNLHWCYINIPMLFMYLKKHKEICVVWTLHDCWPFTGHCPHFSMAKCEKWKTGCYDCPSYMEYPQSITDNSKLMWKLKKKWFTCMPNMTVVTPSHWLEGKIKQSYLDEYSVKVIHNGIDLSIFRPRRSAFRAKHNISDNKFILLGVAYGWGPRKGLDVFIELSNRLDHTKFQIVLVGTDNQIDKQLPVGIISIHYTQNQLELAEIYTESDLFVNPTREENYPTVNMEAIACGTPVLTFRTGGSSEMLDDTCGSVVDCDDVDALESEIIRICETNQFTQEDCIRRAKSFNMNDRYNDYIKLYHEIIQQ